MMDLDPRARVDALHPGFFEKEYIRRLPADEVFSEMILPLAEFDPNALPIPVPEGVSFGWYQGDEETLLRAVRDVEEDWAQYFRGSADHGLCAMADGKPVSFCLLEKMGDYRGMKIGGPGCVGTAPAYRKKGIGLRMVQLATGILKDQGYGLSYIHYTAVSHWYARLGYRTVLQWNGRGLIGTDA